MFESEIVKSMLGKADYFDLLLCHKVEWRPRFSTCLLLLLM